MNQDSVKTEIKEGSHDEFIHFLFGQEPKEKDSIQLEIPDIPKDKNVHLHIYEQLLQIFVDGLKYFYSNDVSASLGIKFASSASFHFSQIQDDRLTGNLKNLFFEGCKISIISP